MTSSSLHEFAKHHVESRAAVTPLHAPLAQEAALSHL